jgi:hypothetical protein
MLEFTTTMNGWYEQMVAVPRPALMTLIRLGAKIVRYLPARKAK